MRSARQDSFIDSRPAVTGALPAADPAAEQAERLALGRLARTRLEEVEVAALVGLEHVVEVERAVAAAVVRRARRPLREAPGDLVVRQVEVEPAGVDVEHDRVAVLGRSRAGRPAADSGATWRTTVPNAVPLMRASEMRTMSRHALLEQLLRASGSGPTPACPGPPFGPAVPQHEHGVARRPRGRVVDPRCDVVDVLEDDRRGRGARKQLRRGGAQLDHGARRGERARARTAMPPSGERGAASGEITSRSGTAAPAISSPSVRPVTVSASRVQERRELVQHRAGCRRRGGGPRRGTRPRAARSRSRACGRESSSKRSSVSGTPDAARDREQVDDRVGAAAERHQQPDRVVEARSAVTICDGRRPSRASSTARAPGRLGRATRPRVDRRGSPRCPGSDMPERLDERGHRRGGAHLVAVAGAVDVARPRARRTRPASSGRRAAPRRSARGRCRRRARGRGTSPARRARP